MLDAETPEAEPLDVSPWPPTFRALQHFNYRLYCSGQLVSLVGSWMQTTALLWLAFELEHQSRWPAWISALLLFPTFLFGPWSGALADRFPKRQVIFWTQTALLLNALVLVELVLLDAVTPWRLAAVAAVAGLIQSADLPSRLAFVMDLVGRDDVDNAVALNAMVFNGARLLGPLAAGWVLYFWGTAACFLLNAVSYLAVLAALSLMTVDGVPGEHPKGSRGLLNGFAYLAEQPRLLALVLVAGTTALTGWPFLSLLPALADHVLACPGEGYSWLLSAVGGGALAAAFCVATFGTPEMRRQFILVGVTLLTLALVGLSQARALPLALACCSLAGLGLGLFFSSGQAILQLSAADHNRGRIMGIWAMVLSGGVPVGNLIVGPSADRWGEPAVLATQGIVCGAAALVVGAVMLAKGRPA